MQRLIKYFVLAFTIMAFISLVLYLFLFTIKEALILSVITGVVFGIFCVGLMERTLKSEVLVINASNQDPQKSLKWYEKQIRSTLHGLRFLYLNTENGVEIYRPQGLYQVMEPYVRLEVTTYEITVSGSRMFCRIISDLLRPAMLGGE